MFARTFRQLLRHVSRTARPPQSRRARAAAHRLRLEQLESRLAPATVTFTNGSGDHTWENPDNWSTHALPGPNDEAVIRSLGTPDFCVTHATEEAETISKLTLTGNASLTTTLDFSAGSLTVSAPVPTNSMIAATTNFTFTLDGTAALALNPLGSYMLSGSRFNYIGGTITQSEGTPTFMMTGSALTIGAGGTSAVTFWARGSNTLAGGLNNGQEIWVQGFNPNNATLTVADGASNAGTILLQSTNNTLSSNLAVASGGTFTNAAGGVIRAVNGTGGGRAVSGNLANYGLVEATDTTLTLTGGVYDAWGGSLRGGAVVANASVRVSSSPVLDPTTTIPLRGNCTLLGDNLAGTTLWVQGFNPNNATLTVADGAGNAGTILLQSTNNTLASNLAVASGGTFTNAAGGVIRAAAGTGGGRAVSGNLTNYGTVTLGGTTATFDGGSLLNQADGVLEGTGTLRSINGAHFTNRGTVRVPPGQLDITGPFTNYDGTTRTLSDGSYDVTGTLRFDNAAIVNSAAAILFNGQQSVIRSVQTNADALNGFARVTAAGSFTLRGGRSLAGVGAGFRNDGTLTVGAASVFAVNGTLANFDPTTGTLNGGTYVIGGTFRFNGAAITTNNANVVLDDSEPGSVGLIVNQNSADALAGILTANAGTLTLLGGRDLTAGAPFSNTGTLTVGAGTTFSAPEYVENGTAVIQAGGTLALGQLDNFDPGTGTLTGGAFRVAGTLQFGGAAVVTNASDLTLDGPAFSVVDESHHDALAGFVTNDVGGRFTVRNIPDYRIGHAFTNLGTLTAGAGGMVTVTANFTQTGTLVVESGGTFVASFRLTDFDTATGTLGGGTYRIAGTFQFAAANVRSLAATLVLDGPDAVVRSGSLPNALVNLAGVAAGGSLALQNGFTLSTTTGTDFTNEGSVTLSGGASSLMVGGDFTQAAGATLTLAGGTLTAGTVVNGAGATLTGTGTIAGNLSNGGLVQIDGAGAATVLTVTGDVTQTGGTLTLHIGLGSGGDFDQLQVGGVATLGGTLNVLAPDTFAPNIGDAFGVLTATGGVTGQFDRVMVPDLGAELYLAVVYGPNGVTLVTSVQG